MAAAEDALALSAPAPSPAVTRSCGCRRPAVKRGHLLVSPAPSGAHVSSPLAALLHPADARRRWWPSYRRGRCGGRGGADDRRRSLPFSRSNGRPGRAKPVGMELVEAEDDGDEGADVDGEDEAGDGDERGTVGAIGSDFVGSRGGSSCR